MHSIQDNVELADLQKAGIGFISNLRNDGMKLHCADCHAVSAVISVAFPKYYFETYAEAVQWLDKTCVWSRCGTCSPTND